MGGRESGTLSLPDSKTGRKVVHLNPPALEVLTVLPRLGGNPYIVAGKKAEAHLVNLEQAWRRIRAPAGLDGVRLQDLRHGFASGDDPRPDRRQGRPEVIKQD